VTDASALISGGLEELQQTRGGKHVSIEGELLTLEVTTTSVTAAHPADCAFGNRLTAGIVKAVPFEVNELTPEHHDGPAHGDPGLRDQGPPVLFALSLLIETIKRSVLTEIDQVFAVLTPEKITAATPERFTVGGPPLLVF